MARDEERRKVTGVAALSAAGQCASAWVRRRWPRHAEKALQQELGISEWDAERILAGRLSKRHLELMLRKYGWQFAAVIFEPYCGAALRLDIELANLKERLARLEREHEGHRDATAMGAADAGAASGDGCLAPDPGRALERETQ